MKEAPRSNRHVLFIFSIYNFYREMFPVAEYFCKHGFEVDIVLGWSGPTADRATAECQAAGFVSHTIPSEFRYGDTSAHVPPRAETRAGRLVKAIRGSFVGKIISVVWVPLRDLGALLKVAIRQFRIRRLAEALVKEINPSLVFAGAYHSCGEFDNGIARACKARAVPYCCLPVSIYAGGERIVVTARFNNLKLGMVTESVLGVDHSLARRILAAIFPTWLRERNGKRLFMFSPEKMVVAQLMGLMSPDPWQKPSNQFDIVFVEAEFSKQLLNESDYSGKIVVCGKPILDVAFENLANVEYEQEFFDYLGFGADQPFILFNVEPSAEHHYSSWEDHWQRFASLMEGMKATKSRVVLSLHPLCDPENYRFVEQQYGFRVSEKYKIGQLYPHCSLVVSFPCSTNAFSQIFDRKLIIYDFFGLTADKYPTHDLYRLPGASYAYDACEVSQQVEDFIKSDQLVPPRPSALQSHPLACAAIYRTVVDQFGL